MWLHINLLKNLIASGDLTWILGRDQKYISHGLVIVGGAILLKRLVPKQRLKKKQIVFLFGTSFFLKIFPWRPNGCGKSALPYSEPHITPTLEGTTSQSIVRIRKKAFRYLRFFTLESIARWMSLVFNYSICKWWKISQNRRRSLIELKLAHILNNSLMAVHYDPLEMSVKYWDSHLIWNTRYISTFIEGGTVSPCFFRKNKLISYSLHIFSSAVSHVFIKTLFFPHPLSVTWQI